MKHFPIFLAVEGRRIVVAGGGETAVAKLRLLLKTEAKLTVIAKDPVPALRRWSAAGDLRLLERAMEPGDALCTALFYAAHDDEAEDRRCARLAHADGALVNIVDNLEDSQFITPAIVDRDPVTVAIGTEGAAPVLARSIKRLLEERLSPTLGALARAAKAFRATAEALPLGRARRAFWSDWYEREGPKAMAAGGDASLATALETLMARHAGRSTAPGRVSFVGAGPGDPELLTLKARAALHDADVVVHDRLVAPEILELARREALLLDVGKEGFGPAMPQAEIDALIVQHAQHGADVVRIKSGDPTVYGRLDEEIAAVEAAEVAWRIVPGITAASAAVAAIGQSLTRRGRNSGVRFLTGHDAHGFAEHDWRALACPGEVAAIYMGKRSARFVQGRLLMHGADPATPVTVIENASRGDQRIVATTLGRLEPRVSDADLSGPALILYGLAPRAALAVVEEDGLIEAAR